MRPLRRWMRRPCTLINPGQPTGSDDMGEPTHSPDVRMRAVCDVQQSAASEERADGSVDVTRWNVFLPALSGVAGAWVPGSGADEGRSLPVSAVTMLELDDGRVFTFDGSPWDAVHPRTGAVSHLEVVARQVL